MSLINSSYFVGPLTVAQLGQVAVQNDLQLCINRNEPEFLQAVLGYELYDALVSGLSQPVVDQKWLDLLNGVVFTSTTNFPGYLPMWAYRNWYMNSQRRLRWVGLSTSITYNANTTLGSQLNLITDSGANNPVSGTNTFTLASLAGATYSIERRGSGTMILGLDYALSNNNQTITLLKSGDVFGPGEIFILRFVSNISAGVPSASGVSPIAGYVYFKYMQDLISQASGIGIVQAQPENAITGVSNLKMRTAWNQMCKDLAMMWLFLAAQGTSVYPDYDITKIDYFRFTPVNSFNL